MPAVPPPKSDPSFEAQWRERFESFAACEDDAGIAGWSSSGLDTRFRFFRRLWAGAPAGSRWLDIGCGAGTYSRWLSEQGLDVVGLDYSQPTLEKARTRLPESIALCAGDASRLPFPDTAFDGALCFGVLQAVSDSSTVVREIARVLKPGGEVWIDALNRDGLAARLTQARRRIRHQGQHLRYESAPRLVGVLCDAGFTGIARHWLTIAPGRLRALQPALESAMFMTTLETLRPMGRLFSHSVLCRARKSMA